MRFIFKQGDPEWANLKVGKSGKTMAEIGCLITDCAMIISDLMGQEHNPKMLLKWMNTHNGFTATGELYWDKIFKYSGGKLKAGQAIQDETEYLLFAVWAWKIKHWVINSDTGFVDPLSGTIISKNKYPSANDTRLLSGLKINTMPNYEGRIVQNTEAGTPEAGEFSLVKNGKRRVITNERSGLAALDAIKSKREVISVNSKDYHNIPRGDDF